MSAEVDALRSALSTFEKEAETGVKEFGAAMDDLDKAIATLQGLGANSHLEIQTAIGQLQNAKSLLADANKMAYQGIDKSEEYRATV